MFKQEWDLGMLSIVFQVVDETAIAVQHDLYKLERPLTAL